MANKITVPYSSEAIADLVALEMEHALHESYPELSCGCGCDRDDDEIANWTDEDILPVCSGCNDCPYPCPTLVSARETASEETLVAVALIT